MQVATLRWYEANLANPQYAAGDAPHGVAFDGTHMWVTNTTAGTVTKLRAADGAVVGTYPTGDRSHGVAVDGTHIWATNFDSHTVTRL